MRASAACESAGYPTSSLTCEGFIGAGGFTAQGLGYPNLTLAIVPGHVGTQPYEVMHRNIVEVTVDRVIENLTKMPPVAGDRGEPGARDIVVKGGFMEVNRYFVEHELSDGLPIIPPTG